jgi:hypothetical protein
MKTDPFLTPPLGQNQCHTKWAWIVATFFGAGFGKPGPGTWGSVAAVLLWAAFAWGLHPTPQTLFFALLAGIALTLVFGIPAASIVARESGRHDPQFVVIDEVAGQWIALLGSAIGAMQSSRSSSSACSTSPSHSPFANSKRSPKAGASSSMMLAQGCMLWV